MTVVSPFPDRPEIILGVTHLLRADGKPVRLLKCPFCDFRNIREDEITHHIQWTNDNAHVVDVKDLDKSRYILTVEPKPKHSPFGPYLGKAALKLAWIKCLWCHYRDKIEFDLSLHMLEKHRQKLLYLKISYRDHAKVRQSDPFARIYGRIEYRLDKAVEIAKRRGQVGRAIEAVRAKS